MSDVESFDAIVIGAGQGGGPLAGSLAGDGKHVALIERKHVGGTCVNEGCTPTKTMVASARVAYLARRSSDYGVISGDISVDQKRVRKRKRDVVEMFRSGSQKSIEKRDGLKLIKGNASFTGTKSIEVALSNGGTKKLESGSIFINTGARPFIPPIDGLEKANFLDSTSIMELDITPDHLIVVGGGYVGLEFGQMFRRFGSDVTIIQRGNQLLSRESPDVAKEVADILEEDGVDIRLNSSASKVGKTTSGVDLHIKNGNDKTTNIHGTHILIATGRRPNTDTLNAEAVGLSLDDNGHIIVNNQLETNIPGMYALGDVTGGPPFTHIAYDDHRILKANLIKGDNQTTDDRPVPYTVFIDPQLGRIGLTETQAREKGYNIQVAKMPMKRAARALEKDETRGFMKALVDTDTDQILGAAILGIEGGEIASVIQMAMMGNLPYTALREAPIAHPTLAESLNNLFSSLE